MSEQATNTVRLTAPQHKRLAELRDLADWKTRKSWMTRHAGSQKATTAKLEAMGLVEIKFRQVAKTGRIMAMGDAYLTDLGREALERWPLKVRTLPEPAHQQGEGEPV